MAREAYRRVSTKQKKHKVVIFISNLFKTRNLLRILFTPVYSLIEIQILTTLILAKPLSLVSPRSLFFRFFYRLYLFFFFCSSHNMELCLT